MKKFFFCCFFSIIVSAHCGLVSFVSKENELYMIDQQSRMEKIDPPNYKKYEINNDDNLKQCYRKLILLNRCAYPFDNNYGSVLTFILKNSHLAYKKFPNSPAIASIYTWYLYNNSSITKALPIILPFIQESKNYPVIPKTIQRMILGRYNLNATKDDLIKYLGNGDINVGRKKLKNLCSYWLAKVNPKYAENIAKSILIARKDMTLINTSEALDTWKNLLSFIDEIKKFHMRVQIYKKEGEEQQKMAKKDLALKEKFYKEKYLKTLSLLKQFEKGPNLLPKLLKIFSKLGRYREKLKKYSNIPNYDELKIKYKKSNEAEVLNIAFQSYILKDFSKCIKKINMMDNKTSDLRLLSIKIYCMRMLKYPKPEIIVALDKILKIDPTNSRAFMAKKMLEAQVEFKTRMSPNVSKR